MTAGGMTEATTINDGGEARQRQRQRLSTRVASKTDEKQLPMTVRARRRQRLSETARGKAEAATFNDIGRQD